MVDGRGGGGSVEKEEESKERQGNNKQLRRPSVHNKQTEHGGGKRERETETVVATLVAKVTMPKSTRPRREMGEEGGGTHDNRGVKEEVRRWRMLMARMMIVAGHDDG